MAKAEIARYGPFLSGCPFRVLYIGMTSFAAGFVESTRHFSAPVCRSLGEHSCNKPCVVYMPKFQYLCLASSTTSFSKTVHIVLSYFLELCAARNPAGPPPIMMTRFEATRSIIPALEASQPVRHVAHIRITQGGVRRTSTGKYQAWPDGYIYGPHFTRCKIMSVIHRVLILS